MFMPFRRDPLRRDMADHQRGIMYFASRHYQKEAAQVPGYHLLRPSSSGSARPDPLRVLAAATWCFESLKSARLNMRLPEELLTAVKDVPPKIGNAYSSAAPPSGTGTRPPPPPWRGSPTCYSRTAPPAAAGVSRIAEGARRPDRHSVPCRQPHGAALQRPGARPREKLYLMNCGYLMLQWLAQ